jgi:molybdate transport system ATP-binding protein
VPIIYVSHAMAEVARLAATLVTLEEGVVTASGPTAQVMSRLGVAGLSGPAEAGSLIEGEVAGHDAEFGLTRLATRAGTLQVARSSAPVGARLRVRILASDVLISLREPVDVSALNILPATVAEIGPRGQGPAVELRLDCGGETLLSRLTAKSASHLGLQPGSMVFAVIKSVSIEGP